MGQIVDPKTGGKDIVWPHDHPVGYLLRLVVGLLNAGFGSLGQPSTAGNVVVPFNGDQPTALPDVPADRAIFNNNTSNSWSIQRYNFTTGQFSGPLFVLSPGQAKTFRAIGGNLKYLAIVSSAAGNQSTTVEWELGGF